jgi:hypothetical protein
MFAGSLVALVTPMQPDGSIDFDAWSRLLEFQVANGSAGIVVAGSTGESATVTDKELRELLLSARKILGTRALLVANAGTSSTATSVERARWISDLAVVDALLVAAPAYVKPTQQGLFRHFEAIAAASRIPVLLTAPTGTGRNEPSGRVGDDAGDGADAISVQMSSISTCCGSAFIKSETLGMAYLLLIECVVCPSRSPPPPGRRADDSARLPWRRVVAAVPARGHHLFLRKLRDVHLRLESVEHGTGG